MPEQADIYLLGGGQDTNQVAAARLLRARPGLRRAVDAGAQVFAICAGMHILGRTFPGPVGTPSTGLGLVDMTGHRLPVRAVGELVMDPYLPGLGPITGFENHRFGSLLGPDARPFGYLQVGTGNGAGHTEGVLAGNIVGTYAHGPALARNPALADLLLTRAIGATLQPLHLPEIEALRPQRLGAAVPDHGRKPLLSRKLIRPGRPQPPIGSPDEPGMTPSARPPSQRGFCETVGRYRRSNVRPDGPRAAGRRRPLGRGLIRRLIRVEIWPIGGSGVSERITPLGAGFSS